MLKVVFFLKKMVVSVLLCVELRKIEYFFCFDFIIFIFFGFRFFYKGCVINEF